MVGFNPFNTATEIEHGRACAAVTPPVAHIYCMSQAESFDGSDL